MCSKVVISVLLLAAGLIALIILVPKSDRESSLSDTNIEDADVSSRWGDHFSPAPPIIDTTHNTAVNFVGTHAATDTNQAEHVEDRIAELLALAMNDDPDSLNTILSELTNRNPQIRKGALEAVVQFGDRAVVPYLQTLAAESEDLGEKSEILAAVDYLSLPSLTEYMTQHPPQTPTQGVSKPREPSVNRFNWRPRRPPVQPSTSR